MNNELKHYGVLGMKWGVRRINKYRSKAAANIDSSRQRFDKAKKNNDSFFGNKKKVMSNVLDAAQTAKNATKYSEKADRIESKHAKKHSNKVARIENKIRKIERKVKDGQVSKEELTAAKDKGKRYLDAREEIFKEMRVSDTNNIYELNDRIYKYVDQMEKRAEWTARVNKGR